MTWFAPSSARAAFAHRVFPGNYRILAPPPSTVAFGIDQGEIAMGQALEGIRVIDFTHDQAGPSCTQMLAWLGADVIKIERPPLGDRARKLWNIDNPEVDSFFFLLLNSNKRSTVIDLKTDEGKEIARRLIRTAMWSPRTSAPG